MGVRLSFEGILLEEFFSKQKQEIEGNVILLR
jgi:hypothetical protein